MPEVRSLMEPKILNHPGVNEMDQCGMYMLKDMLEKAIGTKALESSLDLETLHSQGE